MSVAPHAGIVDFGTFTSPTSTVDGIQGEVPQPLAGQQDYVLTASGWVALSSLGTLVYQGTWNASTNTPTLVSSVGTQGYYYVVSVAGSTDLNGITTWTVGDWAVFNGSVWQKIEGGSTVDITGGQINNTTIGNVTPAAGTFTQVEIPTATTQSTLHENTTITGWIYSGNSFSIASQESSPTGLFFSPDGLKMYVNGSTGDDVNEYTLGTAWNITTATFVTVFSTAAQDSAPADIFFKPDGLTMFVLGDTNNTVYQYTLGTAWSVATASYASKSFSVTTQEATPSGMWFKPDGTTMYVVGTANDTVYQYTLGTAWDVSTASYASKFYSVAAQESSPSQVNLSADGTKMWVLGISGDDIWEYTLGTAWDVSTATPVNNFYVGFQENGPTGLFIDSSAVNRVFIVGSTTADTVFQYNTATNSLEIDTEKLYIDGQLSVNSNLIAGANAYVDGSLTVQGGVTTGGTVAANGLTSSGTTSLASSTSSQTVSLGAGATASGSTKTMNIGTAGVSGSTTTINIGSSVSGSLGTTTIQAPTVNIGQTATQFQVSNTASAVNYVQVTGAATGGSPSIQPQGSDTNIALALSSKSAGNINLFTNNFGSRHFQVTHVAGALVNYIGVSGSATGSAPVLSAQGSDTNISQVFQSKGTGAIDLAAGSSGVNISNGGTVTAITRTAPGTGYTSIPSVAVTAPTTAGGVQATLQVATMETSVGATIASGGTGYTVGDVLSVVGGTSTITATYTVATVSAGVITGLNATTRGSYTVLPSSPVSLSGGTGSGATLNLTWAVTSFTITNAGSGYVEQPTVSFSGGGGSGAAAYATVGSGTVVRSLGSSLDFYTNNGAGFRVLDSGTASSAYWTAYGTSSTPVLRAVSSISGQIGTASTVPLQFITNTSLEQFRVAHTASAVNYVQVTGAATGAGATISTQGSDANVTMNFVTKGSNGFVFQTRGGGTQKTAFTILDGGSAVTNSLTVTPANTGVAPVLASAGSDTNIDLALTTKGTGSVVFNANSIQRATIRGSDGYALLGQNASGTQSLSVAPNGSAVNYVQVISGLTTAAPVISALGSDTNIGLNLTTKGTGAISFNTGNGEQFRVYDNGVASIVNYWSIRGANTGATPLLYAQGADTNVNGVFTSAGTGYLAFRTNGNSQEQFRVTHTASAVNYVQVTGAATGARPTVSAEGSDTNINLVVASKGSGSISLRTSSSTTQLSVTHTASAVNYLQATGAAAGASPVFSVQGTDTNIDLTLTPKGTGYVQFGTYTGTALTIAGYIEIKDSGGTVRKLAVVA